MGMVSSCCWGTRCGDQGVLHGVGGDVVGAEDQPSGPVQSLEPVGDQKLESISIASFGAKDEVSLHASPGWRSWRPHSP
jgi:hypothetical protein